MPRIKLRHKHPRTVQLLKQSSYACSTAVDLHAVA